MIEFITMPFEIAVVAYVYSVVLTQPGMLLATLFSKVTAYINERPEHEWIFKPVILCYKCVCGQMALWTLILHFWLKIHFVGLFIHCAFFISFAIIICELVKKYFDDRT